MISPSPKRQLLEPNTLFRLLRVKPTDTKKVVSNLSQAPLFLWAVRIDGPLAKHLRRARYLLPLTARVIQRRLPRGSRFHLARELFVLSSFGTRMIF